MEAPCLLSQLYARTLSPEDFLNYFFSDAREGNREKITFLLKELSSHDGLRIETAVAALSLSELYSFELSPALCALLDDKGHFSHESIVAFMQQLKDPATIPCLTSTASKHYDYLDYDESFQLARKCIKALSSIGTTDAIIALKALKTNNNLVIASYASKELTKFC